MEMMSSAASPAWSRSATSSRMGSEEGHRSIAHSPTIALQPPHWQVRAWVTRWKSAEL